MDKIYKWNLLCKKCLQLVQLSGIRTNTMETHWNFCFIWLATHNKLMTCLRRSKWSGTNADCHRCLGYPESVIHILRDCPRANSLWLDIVDNGEILEFFSLNHDEWFEFCLSKNLGKDRVRDWKNVFMINCWFLWKWRNASLFEEDFIMPLSPLMVILLFVDQILSALDHPKEQTTNHL